MLLSKSSRRLSRVRPRVIDGHDRYREPVAAWLPSSLPIRNLKANVSSERGRPTNVHVRVWLAVGLSM